MVPLDFPHIEIINKKIHFVDGIIVKLPKEFKKIEFNKELVDFYGNILKGNIINTITGTDPLGFDYVVINNFCYVGLIFLSKIKSKHKDLKKKYPSNTFEKELIVSLLEKERKIACFEEVVPIQFVTSNIHEIRNLNAKISGYVDNMLFDNSQEDWDTAFDNADENIKKIFVGSRLIKFILDNVRFYRPNAIEELPINKNNSFVIHKSLKKMTKILSHDFKKSKIEIELKGKCHKTIYGSKEYFELVLMLLLENAIKYSKDSSTFKPYVEIKETNGTVLIDFYSWGDVIPENERQKLFSSGFRSSVHKNTREGLGMGLHHASKLLNHYNCTIKYTTKKQNIETYGWNIFTIECAEVE